MELFEYGELLGLLVPSGAEYVAMDKDYIYIFGDEPKFRKTDDDSCVWKSDKCLGWMKYWNDFIDLDYITSPDTQRVDWSLALAKVTAKPWKEPRTFQTWAESLDCIDAFWARYATYCNGRMEMWGQEPFLENGEWKRKDGRRPTATIYAPEDMILFRPGEERKYRFSVTAE